MSVKNTPMQSHSLRDFLKVELVSNRGTFSPGKKPKLICPFCQKEILHSDPEMHEGLISRGQVQGSGKEDLIHSRYNCLLVHSNCHRGIVGVGGDKYFEISVRHLVEEEGYYEVRKWLESMATEFEIVGQEALKRFDGIEFLIEYKTTKWDAISDYMD